MRVLNIDSSLNKKVRGLKRKIKSMEEGIRRETDTFPDIDIENGYWHIHLPVKQSFINSKKIPIRVKRLCIQSIIDSTKNLIQKKPKSNIRIRVVAFINFPDLWYSEIIVFFGENHYSGYFYRNNDYQKWIPLEEKRNIAKEWNLKVPDSYGIKGYREILNNDGDIYENELWYLGEK